MTPFRKLLFGSLLVVVGATFALPANALTYSRKSQLVAPSENIRTTLFDGRFKGGVSIATADLDHDGEEETIVGAGPGGGPAIQILNRAGQVKETWFAYDRAFRGGVNVAAGDLDGDGEDEIVTAPQGDMAPVVKIFRGQNLVKAFLAFSSKYHEGLSVAVLPKGPTYAGRIVIGTGGLRENEIRTYSIEGKLTRRWKTTVAGDAETGVRIATGWSDAWHEPIVIIGAGPSVPPRLMVHGLQSKKDLASWLAFSRRTKVGLNVAFRDGTVAVSLQGPGKPVVRTFTDTGRMRDTANVFEESFRGGVRVALRSQDGRVSIAAVPESSNPNKKAIGGKKIVIDLSEQKMILMEGKKKISTRRISSGKWSTPTPIGTFKTRNKIPKAYSRAYRLYMEYWMAITPDGKYGLHALPCWPTRRGCVYEGANHIGTPVSHGCVRQTVADAKSLYQWAPIGTPVIIQK